MPRAFQFDPNRVRAPTLEYVIVADPIHDATWAFEHGDTKFMSIMLMGEVVPFIDDSFPELRERISAKLVRGTSDNSKTVAQDRNNAIARWYADYYNSVLYSLMNDAGAFNAAE